MQVFTHFKDLNTGRSTGKTLRIQPQILYHAAWRSWILGSWIDWEGLLRSARYFLHSLKTGALLRMTGSVREMGPGDKKQTGMVPGKLGHLSRFAAPVKPGSPERTQYKVCSYRILVNTVISQLPATTLLELRVPAIA